MIVSKRSNLCYRILNRLIPNGFVSECSRSRFLIKRTSGEKYCIDILKNGLVYARVYPGG